MSDSSISELASAADTDGTGAGASSGSIDASAPPRINGVVFAHIERDAAGRPTCVVTPEGVCYRVMPDTSGRSYLHITCTVPVEIHRQAVPREPRLAAEGSDATVKRRAMLHAWINAAAAKIRNYIAELDAMDVAAGGVSEVKEAGRPGQISEADAKLMEERIQMDSNGLA